MRLLAVLSLLLLTACRALETQATALERAGAWVFPGEVVWFHARRDCAVLVITTLSDQLKATGGPVLVGSVGAALPRLEARQTVAFNMPGLTPNDVSQRLMSRDLPTGLGLLGSFLNPAKRCLDEAGGLAVQRALLSPDAVLIFDPAARALGLFHRSEGRLYFLRTGV